MAQSYWYYSQQGRQSGPVPSSELKQLAASGRLRPDDLVWKKGIAQWVPASAVRGLFSDGKPAELPSSAVRSRPREHVVAATTRQTSAQGRQIAVRSFIDGQLLVSGSYAAIFDLVKHAFAECGVSVKEASLEQGVIKGKASYAINLGASGGISVVATFCQSQHDTKVEVTASLTRGLDYFGVCKKKSKQVCERITGLIDDQVDSNAFFNDGRAAPTRRNKAQPGRYRRLAITGFWFSVGGLFCFAPGAIVGVIACGKALAGIATSDDSAGYRWAVAGCVIGMIAVFVWLAMISLCSHPEPFTKDVKH